MQGKDKMTSLSHVSAAFFPVTAPRYHQPIYTQTSVKQIKLLQTGKGRESLPVPHTPALYWQSSVSSKCCEVYRVQCRQIGSPMQH